jgi:hypothetical protein
VLDGLPIAPSEETERMPWLALTPPVKVLAEPPSSRVPCVTLAPPVKLLSEPFSVMEPAPAMTIAPPVEPLMLPEKIVLAPSEPTVNVDEPSEMLPLPPLVSCNAAIVFDCVLVSSVAPGATLTTDADTLHAVTLGIRPIADATASGHLRLDGDPQAITGLTSLLKALISPPKNKPEHAG